MGGHLPRISGSDLHLIKKLLNVMCTLHTNRSKTLTIRYIDDPDIFPWMYAVPNPSTAHKYHEIL